MPLMTRDEFETWLRLGHPPLYVPAPFAIEPCVCGDGACKGWRLVPLRLELRPTRGAPVREVTTCR